MKTSSKIFLIVILFGAALWWAWPSKDPQSAGGGTSSVNQSGSPRTRGTSEVAGPDGTRKSRPVRPAAELAEPSAPEVEAILADTNISNEAAAVRLRDFARDQTRTTSQRLEALTHGLNLDVNAFANFGSEPNLPAELASKLLAEFINCNQSPDLQIQGYMTLLRHPDPEVSTQACEMLAFQVGDDLKESNPSVLLQMGQKKLDALRKELKAGTVSPSGP